jgi:hypothetical protein
MLVAETSPNETAPPVRAQLVAALVSDLVGPSQRPQLCQENGEEILIQSPPKQRYCAGILFPRAADALAALNSDDGENEEQLEMNFAEADDGAPPVVFEKQDSNAIDEDDASGDFSMDGANALLPSAMGVSCFCPPPASGLRVCVRAARYEQKPVQVEQRGEVKTKTGFCRLPIECEISIPVSDLPAAREKKSWPILENGAPCGLMLHLHNRSNPRADAEAGSTPDTAACCFWTFSLVNEKAVAVGGKARNGDCFFQVEFEVRGGAGEACFLPLPSGARSGQDEDARSAQLLYRHRHAFAVGHGCAPEWDETEGGQASCVRSATLPIFEMTPIMPRELPSINLAMRALANEDFSGLPLLCDEYESWIESQSARIANEIKTDLQDVAREHLQRCRECLQRMRAGVLLLESEPSVRRAFALMNRAMLWQQIHSSQHLREWRVEKGNALSITAWREPGEEEEAARAWRPFQIAFVLMNLRAAFEPSSPDRSALDLIWFPTGGGKTEAYLGLTAYFILMSRLQNADAEGTVVLMRYTLRLLTQQQYARGAALICALEKLRRENPRELGEARITIGLWVGSAATPNTRADAVKTLRAMQNGAQENPFVVLKCPWCGAAMGPVENSKRVRGYHEERHPARVALRCHDTACEYSRHDLPLLVVDEDIYQTPPSLLLGTVDKFALLAWKPEARSLFGWREGAPRQAPPQLIVQDELHLISGPLGSTVGHYETLIDELCRDEKTRIGAKVIASTATIARAREQCHALFGCDEKNVSVFPPQGLDANESFFAREDKQQNGRWYCGVFGVAQTAVQVQVRVVATLLQAAKSAQVENEKGRDPYWTLLSYFNSLRELGYAASLLSSSVVEYLNRIYTRENIARGADGERRYINRTLELTSRIASHQISANLRAMEVSYPKVGEENPVDVCLATNMVSVGLDVSRLGLMVMTGQPKTTAEYIQATSRVGRSQSGPGLVIALYNSGRPRDRSHYERFRAYHAAIYRDVEPTSVTSFSAPVRERALHAILTAFHRVWNASENSSRAEAPSDEVFEAVREIIARRVQNVDAEERNATLRLLDERRADWTRWSPSDYGGIVPQGSEAPLLFPAGKTPPENWKDRVWPTPTSMRDVDAQCEARVLPDEYPRPSNEPEA